MSNAWRAALLVVGTASLVIGLVGIVLPILPTTPFLLLAAACYARASSRLYGWLLGQRTFGPIIVAWRRSRSLPPGVKPRALLMVAIAFTVSVVLVDVLALRILLAAIGVMVAVILTRLPTAQVEPASVTMTPPPSQEDAP